jgi:hypothetical protein
MGEGDVEFAVELHEILIHPTLKLSLVKANA